MLDRFAIYAAPCSYPRVTYSDPKVTHSDPKVTHSDPTHLPLPPPASPDNCQAISEVYWDLWVVVVVVATNFIVSSRQALRPFASTAIPSRSLPDPCLSFTINLQPPDWIHPNWPGRYILIVIFWTRKLNIFFLPSKSIFLNPIFMLRPFLFTRSDDWGLAIRGSGAGQTLPLDLHCGCAGGHRRHHPPGHY